MNNFKKRLANMPVDERINFLEIPTYLANSSAGERLKKILTNFDFLDVKVSTLGVQPLIDDYDLALESQLEFSEKIKDSLSLIQIAIKLAANVLSEDPTQLAGQLWGRLLSFKNPEIQAMLTQAQQLEEYIWLRPLTSNLRPPKGSLLRTLTGHLDWVEAVAITPDGKIAVSASRDRTLKVWDLHSGTELHTLTGHHGYVEAVAITPDGKIGVSSANDDTLKVWELQSGNEMRTLIGRTGTMNGVTITPDSQLVISTPGGKTRIWDLQSGKEVLTLTENTATVNVVAITPDRKLAILASSDTTLHVRDIKSETELSAILILRFHDIETLTFIGFYNS